MHCLRQGLRAGNRDCVEGLASVERLTWAILWWNLPSSSLILPREPKSGDPVVMISGTGQEMDPQCVFGAKLEKLEKKDIVAHWEIELFRTLPYFPKLKSSKSRWRVEEIKGAETN